MYNDTESTMKVDSPGICTELAMQVVTPISQKAALLRLDRMRETGLTPLAIEETYWIQS